MNIALFYATREGQSRRVAEHVADELRLNGGVECEVYDVAKLQEPVSLDDFDAVILAASVHLGKHEREMIGFVRRHRVELTWLPTAFLSLSGSEATVEMSEVTPELRTQAALEVREVLERFEKQTGWQPTAVLPVAGAMRYSQYNWLVRWVVRRIVRKASGGAADTEHDHEYTDWAALDRFVDTFLYRVRATGPGWPHPAPPASG